MNDLQKEFEATGYTSWINSDLYPDGKIYTQEYTQWLERRVQALSMSGDSVSNSQIEELFPFEDENNATPTKPIERIAAYNSRQAARREGAIRLLGLIHSR